VSASASTVDFTIRGPIKRDDLQGLADRVCFLLRGRRADLLRCDVSSVEVDAVCVDALARLALGARRNGCLIQLRGATPELRKLVAFMGLESVLPLEPEEPPAA
jgi:ABC-type transporter Mla MlaB component